MSRQIKGRIFPRGKSKNFYLQYYFNKKQFVVVLRDADGEPIRDRRKAQLAAQEILAPINAASRADKLKKIQEAVEDADAKAERLAAEQAERLRVQEERRRNERARIADGWRLFMSCPKRPASCRRYPADETPRNTTAGNYRAYYQHFAAWMEDQRPSAVLLSEVTQDDAAEFMEAVQQSSASGTFNKYLQFLRLFFEVIMRAGKIAAAENPFAEIERAENRYNSKRPLAREQITALIDAADGEMRFMFALGYYTGFRQGDVCTLLWSEIDLARRVIERIPRKTENTIHDPAEALVKIGIPRKLTSMLSEIPPKDRTGYVLPELAALYLAGNESAINKRVQAHFARCGIAVHREGTGPGTGKRAVVEVGFHSLRYSYISHHAEAGTPAPVIQKNSGHKSPAMTEHYTRISDRAAVQYAEALALPEPAADVVIDVEAVDAEPERDEMRELAAVLPIEDVREIVERYKKMPPESRQPAIDRG